MRIFILLLATFVFHVSLVGRIEEISSFSEINTYLPLNTYEFAETLIILDLDNTLITVDHEDQLGSDHWVEKLFCYLRDELHIPSEQALDQAIAAFIALQPSLRYCCIEKDTLDVIGNIHMRGISVMGLTIRSHCLVPHTTQELDRLGFVFTRHGQDMSLITPCNMPLMIRNGIIFTQGADKGIALLTYFKHNPHVTFKRIIMIDDKRKHLQAVEKACQQLDIDFIGLRYGHLDERVQSFVFCPEKHLPHNSQKKGATHMKSTAHLASYLILEHNNQILFGRRCNTGYQDNRWGLVSGHVEEGESFVDAMVREAKEEAGITIAPQDLNVIHISHRKSNHDYVDVFMHCTTWSGDITNTEPHKCAELRFFDKDNLPEDMMDYLPAIFEAIQKKICFQEIGF